MSFGRIDGSKWGIKNKEGGCRGINFRGVGILSLLNKRERERKGGRERTSLEAELRNSDAKRKRGKNYSPIGGRENLGGDLDNFA